MDPEFCVEFDGDLRLAQGIRFFNVLPTCGEEEEKEEEEPKPETTPFLRLAFVFSLTGWHVCCDQTYKNNEPGFAVGEPHRESGTRSDFWMFFCDRN